jgi:hypothetical protein
MREQTVARIEEVLALLLIWVALPPPMDLLESGYHQKVLPPQIPHLAPPLSSGLRCELTYSGGQRL